MSFPSERQQEIRRSILEFLEKQASQTAVHAVCPHCGRAMTMTPTTFSLCGTELTRTVRLSMCDCQTDSPLQQAV